MAELTGKDKARIFLSLLGEQALSRIMRYLPSTHAEKLQRAFQGGGKVSPDLIQKVVEEFSHFSSLPSSSLSRQEMKRSEGPSASVKRLARVLEGERPQMIAFLLKRVIPQLSQEVLPELAEKKRGVETSLSSLEWVPLSDPVQEKLQTLVNQALSKNETR